MRPNRSRAASAIRSAVTGSAMSPATVSRSLSSDGLIVRALATTAHPRPRYPVTRPAPMPCDPPVMTATLPVMMPAPDRSGAGSAAWSARSSRGPGAVTSGSPAARAGPAACHRPSERPRPGSLHSRRRCPCPASSSARSASRASVSSTAGPGVPSGTSVTNVVRNSEPGAPAARPGSLGCGDRAVTSSVRHTRSGIEARTSSSWPSSAAANSPRVRHSPGRSGGRHSRSRCPCAASSRDRAASRPRMSATA